VTCEPLNPWVREALSLASDTKEVRLGHGAIQEAADAFGRCFGDAVPIVVADIATFEAAGRKTFDVLSRAGLNPADAFVFEDPDLHARHNYVVRLQQHLGLTEAVPIAVGSGTINDLVKLAAHRCRRSYMVAGTAASMDGYTAFGASINRAGSKQTFYCPAPRAVIADLDVICESPAELNAAGYADLAAKTTSGADWILADALGIEAITPEAWGMVQNKLEDWLGDPAGVRSRSPQAIRSLMEGLLMTGFAMQRCQSSRPASGAEHQFSHLWDMQNHQHEGRTPLHGHKVAIGTLASTLLYEVLLEAPIQTIDVQRVCAEWPEGGTIARLATHAHESLALRAVAIRESQAKYVDRYALSQRLHRLQKVWPELRGRLAGRLIRSDRLREMLTDAGAPTDPDSIGIDRRRLRRSYVEAYQIRRRYTVLDLAVESGMLPSCLDRLFSQDGAWIADVCPPASTPCASAPCVPKRNAQYRPAPADRGETNP